MKNPEAINCPLCKSSNVENILNLNCGIFDGSTLYQNAIVNTCNHCGHIYNQLSSKDIQGLTKYYNDEYAPINMGATYKTGNMPGGDGHDACERYNKIFQYISPYLNRESKVLDVGCAIGGFLDYLNDQGMIHLSGIDLTESFVDHVSQIGKYNIKLGSAEAIPFEDSSFDILIINQVIEHTVAPWKVFKEAKRVLVNGGILFLGVPDALRYADMCSFDFYWLLIRDHIQHFDIEHLKLLAAIEGFELLDFNKNDTLALSTELALPNLNVLFRHTGKEGLLNITDGCFKLKKKFKEYIAINFDRLNKRNRPITDLIISHNPLYVWGIGSEFLYLYENTRLKKCNIVGLIDVNPYKQANLMVGGLPIVAPHVLKNADTSSKVLITAVAYTKAITESVESFNYKGQIIDL